MTRTIAPATEDQVLDIQCALEHLAQARMRLKKGGVSQAPLDKLQLTVKSVEGALRHARHRVWRTQAAKP